jgi:histidyl-tRNA synthetase
MKQGFDKALHTAAHFGFIPIDAPRVTESDIEATKDCADHPHFEAAEKAAFIRTYEERGLASEPHPLAVIYKRAPRKVRPGGYTLHFVGSSAGVSEAVLIRTACSILADEGHKDVRVELNSIGDKESLGTYERELANYVRKTSIELDERIRGEIKKDIFNIFRLEDEACKALAEAAPSSISYLSPASRLYFKEVLEYIEVLNVEFRLSPSLVGDRAHSSHAIFAIREAGALGPSTLAMGYTYSRLCRKSGLKKEIPMVGISLFLDAKAAPPKIYRELPRPKFYLVQLGREAKMRSLPLIEHLRMHRIPVAHIIGKDKITAQLSGAEQSRATHLIIIGQKEALDHTATIRNVATRAQDTIPLDMLPSFLKNIPI